ncbi:hypothetical protein AOE01nite_19070 [Acetobacter oeni]|uniref:Uncharacterized protein n=1 Tax=Acetobacter oeni TaxID=304077 RepID=A0A511XL57_9PROT|nr:hypothetical protein AOE01nite_19070 [Acetobacter oeni]
MRQLCRLVFPVVRDPASPEISLLTIGIARLWGRDQCGVKDLTRYRKIACIVQGDVKTIE